MQGLKKAAVLFALLSGILLMTACPSQTNIRKINADPDRYRGKEVGIAGTVTNSYGAMGAGAYEIDDGTGKMTTWTFETAAPNGLRRAGLSKNGFFEVGKTYSVIGYPARDGSALAFVEQITLPDGRTIRIWFGDPNGSN